MGRYVGLSINKGTGGGGGSGTIVSTSAYTKATGIATAANNNVLSVTLGDNTYRSIQYNSVGLITGFNEKIGDEEKGYSLTYDSGTNLVSTITQQDNTFAVYSFSSSPGPINEGSSGTFNVSTEGVADGTTLYYDTNLSDSDFSGSTENGSFNITSNAGSFSVTLAEDVTTEGTEYMIASIYTDSGRTKQVASSASVTINDTSEASTVPGGTIFHATSGWNQQTSHSWTIPVGVTYVSVVCVGGGGGGETNHDGASAGGGGLAYKNNITVTAGQVVTVKVGGGGFATSNGVTAAPDGGDSYITYGGVNYAYAVGGRGGNGNTSSNNWYDNSGSFPNTNSDGGGAGGAGFHGGGYRSGGGGAGGYNGGGNTSSGRGCNSSNYAAPQTGQNGGGGGGNGYNGSSPWYSGGGGGTGVYGEGTSGTKSDANGNNSPDDATDFAGKGGSTANNTGLRGYCVEDNSGNYAAGSNLGNGYDRGTQASLHGSSHHTPDGGFPGGGGGGSNSGSSAGCGGHGMVRIVYGLVSSAQRTFPSTNVAESTTYSGGIAEGVNGIQLMY